MARDDSQWGDDDCQFSSRDSDDSPLLYRHERSRLVKERSDRRWPVTIIAKFSLFSTAMILFCVFMYIPVYNRANDQMPKVAVAGWSIHTNRDTKIYVQPNNVTTIHEPIYICPKKNREKLFLLIVVCSSTTNFERRVAIRETWGNSTNFVESAKLFHAVHEKYKNYNYSYDLYSEMNYTDRRRRGVEAEERVRVTEGVGNKSTEDFELKSEVGFGKTDSTGVDTAMDALENKDFVDLEKLQSTVAITTKKIHRKRDLTSFNRILPELAKALSVPMPTDEKMLPEFDMNKEIGGQENDIDYNYDYDTNIMKIPPRGEENFDLENVIAKIRENYPKTDVNFKVVFLLGLPAKDNSSEIQDKIDEEVDKYGDIIQEGFIDSYNNLTLKSIMMLKWVTNNCGDSVRYILKTDDDMYINVPNLMMNLQNRSKIHDQTIEKEKEYLLIGDLICGARPVLDTSNKWYSPRYMYSGRIYPRYLSGTGYVLSTPTAHALYQAALRTHYFHLEDIFITGMCSLRATPRITPRDEPGFSYNGGGGACAVHSKLTAHRVTPYRMKRVATLLRDLGYVDRCERLRLTQIKTHRESRMFIIYKYLRLVVGGQC